MFMNFLAAIGTFIICVALFVPTAIYGGIIGDRIAMNEFNGRKLKRFSCTLVFSIIGAALFPLTYIVMCCNYEDVSREADKFIERFIIR